MENNHHVNCAHQVAEMNRLMKCINLLRYHIFQKPLDRQRLDNLPHNTTLDLQAIATDGEEQEVAKPSLTNSCTGKSFLTVVDDSSGSNKKISVVSSKTEKFVILEEHVSVPASNVAYGIFDQITIGSIVMVVTFKSSDRDRSQYFITQVLANKKEEPKSTVESTDKNPVSNGLRKSQINGVVLAVRMDQSLLLIETDISYLVSKFEQVTYLALPGDRVSVLCTATIDYNGGLDEILEVIEVRPLRILNVICNVKRCYEGYCIAGDEYLFYYVYHDYPTFMDGVRICVDIIETDENFLGYKYRIINVIESMNGEMLSNVPESLSVSHTDREADLKSNIFVSNTEICYFENIQQEKIVDFRVKNQNDIELHIQKIRISATTNEANFKLISSCPLVCNPYETQIIEIQIVSEKYGLLHTCVTLDFGKFCIHRTMLILVQNEYESTCVEKSILFNFFQKLRLQNDQLIKTLPSSQVVPGRQFLPKPRFALRFNIAWHTPSVEEVIDITQRDSAKFVTDIDLSSYAAQMTKLVMFEECENMRLLRLFNQRRSVLIKMGGHLALKIPNFQSRRFKPVVGNVVTASIYDGLYTTKDNLIYEGYVHQLIDDYILMQFTERFHERYNGDDCEIKFIPSRSQYHKQYFSINIASSILDERVLFPDESHIEQKKVRIPVILQKDGTMLLYNRTYTFYNSDLNTIQRSAVVNVLRGELSVVPYVIYGPPGTGKTRTVIELVLQIVRFEPNARIVIATPSNSAANLILELLYESNCLSMGEYVRLISMTALDRIEMPAHLRDCLITLGGESIENNNKIKKSLTRHKITIGTCSIIGGLIASRLDTFTHIIVDEAGQCTEPEIMTALVQMRRPNGQIVLAGDPKQLQPVVLSQTAAKSGLSISFLERILDRKIYQRDYEAFPDTLGYNPLVVTLLRNNYRSLPSILNVFNKLFYDDQLVANVDMETSREYKLITNLHKFFHPNECRTKGFGVFFRGLDSMNTRSHRDPSWYNPREAREVFSIVNQLFSNGISMDDVGVITPYSRQVKFIRSLFQVPKREGSNIQPKIGSVEEFQGQERDYIIMSLVRTPQCIQQCENSFVSSERHINVAISRPRVFLCIVGHPQAFAKSQYWNDLIQICVENGTYIGYKLPGTDDSVDTEESTSE